MIDRDAESPLLRAWFIEEGAGGVPPHLLGAIADATRGRDQQRAWRARLSTAPAVGLRDGGGVLVLVILAGLVMALVAGALAPVGGAPSDQVRSRLFHATAPWTFDALPGVCPQQVAAALPDGPLPEVGPPANAHPHNGLIALGTHALVDPVTGTTTTVDLAGSEHSMGGSIYGNRWSPDGRWLAVGWSQPPPCRDVYLVASDGTRLVDVTGYPSGDETIDVAWSPDGHWLAVSRWTGVTAVGPDGVAIDALEIGEDGGARSGRRLWTRADVTSIESLDWGADGSLAWTYDSDAGMGMAVLRPGQTLPDPIDLGGVSLINARWSAAGTELVAVGVDSTQPEAQGDVYVVNPAVRSVRPMDLPVRPSTGKYAWDAEISTSSDGWVVVPARSDTTGVTDIYRVRLDGTDIRNLTSLEGAGRSLRWNAVLSPDETQVAFLKEGRLWVVDADGRTAERQLGGVEQLIAWQPVP